MAFFFLMYLPMGLSLLQKSRAYYSDERTIRKQNHKTNLIFKKNKRLPGEKGSTITSIFSCSACFGMSFPIWLNSIYFRTFFTLPFFLSMFSAKMFLDSSKITKSSRRMVMNASRFRTNVCSFLVFFVVSLFQLPWKIMATSMKLKILIPLKPFVTYLTYKSICCQ